MAGGVRGAGAKPPSQEAYFVAMGGILVLLLLLCCYFLYFCIKRVKELNEEMREQSVTRPVRPTGTATASGQYAVQPAVRDSATALARLCRQLPAGPAPTGHAVFPAASSPAAARATHSPRAASPDSAAEAPPAAAADGPPAPVVATPAAVKPPPTASAPPPVTEVPVR